MVDLAKCLGYDCPTKERCRRYTAPEGILQSWVLPPVKGPDCEWFWPDQMGSASAHADGER